MHTFIGINACEHACTVQLVPKTFLLNRGTFSCVIFLSFPLAAAFTEAVNEFYCCLETQEQEQLSFDNYKGTAKASQSLKAGMEGLLDFLTRCWCVCDLINDGSVLS